MHSTAIKGIGRPVRGAEPMDRAVKSAVLFLSYAPRREEWPTAQVGCHRSGGEILKFSQPAIAPFQSDQKCGAGLPVSAASQD
jgi:hypothetical protein